MKRAGVVLFLPFALLLSGCSERKASVGFEDVQSKVNALTAKQIAEEAMKIAGKTCIYTNENVTWEELG